MIPISHDPVAAGKQLARLLQGMRAETLLGPESMLADAITRLLRRPTCPSCGNEIDPTLCKCGNPIEHSEMLGHLPTPHGCDCVCLTPNPLLLVAEKPTQPPSPLDE